MKTITVSNRLAERIERLRNLEFGGYQTELESILEVVNKLYWMTCVGKDEKGVAQFAEDIHNSMGICLSYYDILRAAYYNDDELQEESTI